MKFVAMTTGYGRTSSSGVGFQGTGAAAKPEEYASHLLELYGKCAGSRGEPLGRSNLPEVQPLIESVTLLAKSRPERRRKHLS